MPAPVTAIVESATQISPNFIRVVFTGPELKVVGSDTPLYDQRIKLIFPNPGQPLPEFPQEGLWYEEWAKLPEDSRGVMRTYSIRSLERTEEATRMTVDFVLHIAPGLTGPASTWAASATAGDEILIVAPRLDAEYMGGIEFAPGAATKVILAGDETAAPAIARILEDLADSDLPGTAMIEIPSDDDALAIEGPSSIDVKWLPRNGRKHGELLMETLALHHEETEAAATSEGELVWETPVFSATGEQITESNPRSGDYYWIAGESGVVTSIRRSLVKEKGLDRSQVAFMGYWKHGVSMRG